MFEWKLQREVRLGLIGSGGRGRGLLRNLLAMDDVAVTAVSDPVERSLQLGLDEVTAAGRPEAAGYADYRELLARGDLDGVIIATSWSTHIEIAIAAMRAGKVPGMEVGGASSLQECWDLVRASEETGIPCMLLENCCYGRNEMMLLHMVKLGLFGELVHCQCGYQHDLRKEIITGEPWHYRFYHHLRRNGDVYPTHGLGPMAKCLDIHRGNRFMTLVSMASKSRGLREWAETRLGPDHHLARTEFALGDIVTSMIKCARGETIVIVHDTSLPRPYSRHKRVQGTKGIYMEDNASIHLEGKSPDHMWEPLQSYRAQYEHPLWKEYEEQGIRGGHGGVDYLCLRALVESIGNKTPPPIDVYDAAAWMAVTVLSEQSVALGGQPVSFPDFTNGKWVERTAGQAGKYSLDQVDPGQFQGKPSE